MSTSSPANHLAVNSTATAQISVVLDAVHFSAEKHKYQRRKNIQQTPYICHPIRVADLLTKVAKVTDIRVLISALLHDTVEDTDTSFEEITHRFGSQIAAIVREVTDDKTLPKQVRKQQQIDHAPHVSTEAKLVKLADKLDNLTDLLTTTPVGWSPQRVADYFDWGEKVVHGLRGTNQYLEKALDDVFAQRQKAIENASQQ